MMARHSPEGAIECLYRIKEFREWVQTNILFPLVPDAIVDPLRAQLLAAEHTLLAYLWDQGQIDEVAALLKATSGPPKDFAMRSEE